MSERLVVVCADCKGDVTGQAPVLLVSSATRFACLCSRCAMSYGSADLAFERLRVLFVSDLPWDSPPDPSGESQAA